MDDTLVELEGINGERFDLTNGDRGVYLGTDIKGAFYDPPVKVVYEEPGNWPGARYLNHRILRRDITFGVEILHDKSESWSYRDSEWRKAWAFNRDCKLIITTPESGTRYLKLRLGESPEVSMVTNPRHPTNTINRTVMVCIAGDPFWYEDDAVHPFVTTLDTTFDPNPLPWPWPHEAIPSETISFTVDDANPTDQLIFPKWGLPGSTQAPAEPYIPGLPWLGAPKSPATIWTVPDYSFEDPALANRRVRMPGLIGGLRTEEVQAVYLTGKPTSGTFTLTLNSETTVPIAYNASNSAVQSALVNLASIALGDVSVTRAAATNEIQVITVSGGATGGTFTLTFEGQTTTGIPYNASIGTVLARLRALSNINNADLTGHVEITNEVQIVQPVGEPTDGTFTLSFDGQTTAPIDWDASSFRVATELQRLTNIDDVYVYKAPGSYQPWRVRFQGALSGVDVPELTADVTGLTGGAGIDMEISTEDEGALSYIVTFRGSLAGFDFTNLVADAAGLTGGTPSVDVATSVDGSRPYLVRFTGDLSGLNMSLMTVDGSGLVGGAGLGGYAAANREGKTAPAENVVIDSDPRVEQVSSESGSPIWSRMNGVRFRHYIPPYTKSKTFEIKVSGCVPGQMGTLRLPRPWTRPWGLQ